MAFARYGHLRNPATAPPVCRRPCRLGHRAVRVSAAGASPRIGLTQFTVAQLKIIREVITLSVFKPFAMAYLNPPLKWDCRWADLCMVDAVYFIFRGAG